MTEEHAANLYDAVNSWDPDDEFFLRFATENPEARVLDLGCGTGRITTRIAAKVNSVTGIDPDGSRVDAAQRKPGGEGVEWIIGDSRDPEARGWEQWTKERSHKTVELPQGSTEHWYQTTAVDEASGLVDFRAHQVDAAGNETSGSARLRFRSQEHLRSMLTEAGFRVEEVFGGFQREPVGQGVGSLVVIASR